VCGIAGAIGSVDDCIVDAVVKVRDALAHRGPDAHGLWRHCVDNVGSGVVLGHHRLSIIDLSDQANQPMVDKVSGCVIVYNGEVYNFLALREELRTYGVAFNTKSDTEVVLKAYQQWGDQCLHRFNGMFALAIWDPKHRHVFFARDRLGIKPLYVAEVDRPNHRKVWLFASEVRALLASGLVPRKLDPVGLASYVWNGFVMGPHTIVRDVTLIPAASSMTITLDGQRSDSARYWQMPSANTSAPHSAITSLSDTLTEAVKMRLVSDVPLGVFMSGGIDSSAVATLASSSAEQTIKTFNVSFDEVEFDESTHARALAQAVNAEHHEIRLTEALFSDQMPNALASIDQPTFDGVNTYVISRAVREAGITVALAGTGGDELFGGYRSFVDLPRLSRWARRAGALPQCALRSGAKIVTRLKTGPPGEVGPQTRWGKLPDVLRTRGRLVELYQVAYGLFTQAFIQELAAPVLHDQTHYGLPRSRAQELTDLISASNQLHAISLLELSCFLGERLLRDTDAASMAVGLEVRVPLLDHRILEALANLQMAERFGQLPRKELLRHTAMGKLDPKIFDRPKSGFVLPLELWCRCRLRPMVAQTLMDSALCRSVGLAPEAVARLWRAFDAEAPGIYWSRVWALFILLRWCQKHHVTL